MNSTARTNWLPPIGTLVIAAALKVGLLLAGVVPFNADEAVVGLMARHIVQGERPAFFYGQSYLGSLDAWLIAGAFATLGESVLAIRLVQVVLYLATILTAYLLALKIYGSRWIASAAALFLAIPTVLVTLYTTVTLGGYGETLLIGNILLLLALSLGATPRHWAGWMLFGLLGGLGFWTFPLILVYLVPAGVYLYWSGRRAGQTGATRWLLAAAGLLAGMAPWWWFTLTAPNGLSTLFETGGSAIAGASNTHPLFAVLNHVFNFLLFGLTVVFGLRPPWSARFLALPLVPFALAVNCALLVFIVSRTTSPRWRDAMQPARRLLAGSGLLLVLAFIFTPFGADPSGRYFLPLTVPLALFMAEMLNVLRLRRRQRRTPGRKWFGNALALGIIAFNWWGNVQSAAAYLPGITTQFDSIGQVDQRSMNDVITFLRQHGENRGYTNYWVSFPLVFLTQEELIYAARLPYHGDFRYTTRYDRYAPYSRAVDASTKVSYITTRHPALDDRIRQGFNGLGVSYKEQQIGDFHIFYALSRKVVPEELGLGVACCEANP